MKFVSDKEGSHCSLLPLYRLKMVLRRAGNAGAGGARRPGGHNIGPTSSFGHSISLPSNRLQQLCGVLRGLLKPIFGNSQSPVRERALSGNPDFGGGQSALQRISPVNRRKSEQIHAHPAAKRPAAEIPASRGGLLARQSAGRICGL